MKKILPIALLLIFFLTLKLAYNGIRLSDTNIYFNLAQQLIQGKVLYKDIFFSNFPFFSYVSFIYYLLSWQNINLFFFTSALEVALISTLVYIITLNKTGDYLIAITSASFYTLSFMVLSTSDHQTGVFTASLFSIISFYFLEKKNIVFSGIFMAVAIFTKAYFLPLLASFFIYVLIKEKLKGAINFSLASALTGLLILSPFLIQAPNEMIKDIFGFSLSRPAGLSKTNILWFFITRDLPFFTLLVFNIFLIRRKLLFGLISIFSIIFFFGYQDVYYLYLNFVPPFLAVSFPSFYYFFKNKFNLQRYVIPTLIFAFIVFNLSLYLSFYKDLGKVNNLNQILNTINKEKPKYLYGVNDITPALIVLSKIPALNGINDAHEYFFMRGIYDAKKLTNDAVNNKTIVVTHGASYLDYNIKQDILDNIFVKEEIYKNCKNILSVPVIAEGDTNRINLFKCY